MLEINNERRYRTEDSVLYKGEVWDYLNSGLTRNVYVNSDRTKVVKFLIEPLGFNHNQLEGEIYRNSNDKDSMGVTHYDEVYNVVEQEFLVSIEESDRELTMGQIQFASSCRNEVGWDSEGRLKCFDLSEYKKW